MTVVGSVKVVVPVTVKVVVAPTPGTVKVVVSVTVLLAPESVTVVGTVTVDLSAAGQVAEFETVIVTVVGVAAHLLDGTLLVTVRIVVPGADDA